MQAKQYVREHLDLAIEAARRTVDAREMAAIPRCELVPLAVDLGDVMGAQEKRLQLQLRNVGQVILRQSHLGKCSLSCHLMQLCRPCPLLLV